jgi:hypothetical protein
MIKLVILIWPNKNLIKEDSNIKHSKIIKNNIINNTEELTNKWMSMIVI